MFLLKCGVVLIFFIIVESEAGFYRHDYYCSGVHNYCYKLHRVKKTWQEARKQCTLEGATLASPLNSSLQNLLGSVVDQSVGKYYVGVHATFYPGDWNSVEGIPLSRFSDGLRNIILDSSEKQCAMMTDSYTIVGTECDERYPFVCYVPYTPTEPLKHQDNEEFPCGTGDKGYMLSNTTGKCYKSHKHLLTWSEAYHVCNAESAHLAVIDSGDEAQVIYDIYYNYLQITHFNDMNYQVIGHIGVVDWERDGNYYTVNGEPFKSSMHFGWPEEDDSVTKDYFRSARYFGSINRQIKLVMLPQYELPFICEKDPEM